LSSAFQDIIWFNFYEAQLLFLQQADKCEIDESNDSPVTGETIPIQDELQKYVIDWPT
jgi:hypothetical protein